MKRARAIQISLSLSLSLSLTIRGEITARNVPCLRHRHCFVIDRNAAVNSHVTQLHCKIAAFKLLLFNRLNRREIDCSSVRHVRSFGESRPPSLPRSLVRSFALGDLLHLADYDRLKNPAWGHT